MDLFHYIKTVFSNFLNNFHHLGKYSLDCSLEELHRVHKQLILENWALKKSLVLLYYSQHKEQQEDCKNELGYLQSQYEPDAFPYPTLKHIYTPKAGFDKKQGLPFVEHGSKRLYFPQTWSIDTAIKSYTNFIERENILGGGFTEKAPHQYQSKDIKIDKGDILLDIGCAEGLLALDSIEKIKEAYLFEGDEQWIKPLKATFEPYKSKIHIIAKYVGSTLSATTTDLHSIFKDNKGQNFFVKMDIEGAEEKVLKSNRDFFLSQNKIKLACCLYHRADHQTSIPALLNEWGFQTEFSNGVMFFQLDPNLQPPYLRKGIIRGIRQ